MSLLTSIHQRLNQVNSEVGWPALIDTEQHDKLAERMANLALVHFGPLDGHPDAQGLGMKLIQRHRDSLDARPDGFLADHANIAGDAGTGLYVLLAYDPTHAIAISDPAEWEAVASKYLPQSDRFCDVEITVGCTPSNGPLTLPVKVGEFICVFRCCERCLAWFHLAPQIREDTQLNGWDDDWDRR